MKDLIWVERGIPQDLMQILTSSDFIPSAEIRLPSDMILINKVTQIENSEGDISHTVVIDKNTIVTCQTNILKIWDINRGIIKRYS